MASDITPDAGPNGGAGQEEEAAALIFKLQYIKDLSFENPRAPQVYEMTEQPAVNVGVNVAAQDLGNRNYEVVLTISADARTGDDVVFMAELEYAGIAEIGPIDEQHIQPMVLIEAPRFLFPFARAILANVTRDSGFPPLLIGAMDFMQMYRESMANMQDAGPEGTAD